MVPRLDNPYRLVAEVMLFQYLPVELCGSVVSFYEYICHNGKSILLHPWTFLASKNGLSVMINDKVQQQIVLPSAHVNTVLEAMHNDMSHPGKDRTLSLLKDRFYWPGMSKDVGTLSLLVTCR
jgi:hypothetical protein